MELEWVQKALGAMLLQPHQAACSKQAAPLTNNASSAAAMRGGES